MRSKEAISAPAGARSTRKLWVALGWLAAAGLGAVCGLSAEVRAEGRGGGMHKSALVAVMPGMAAGKRCHINKNGVRRCRKRHKPAAALRLGNAVALTISRRRQKGLSAALDGRVLMQITPDGESSPVRYLDNHGVARPAGYFPVTIREVNDGYFAASMGVEGARVSHEIWLVRKSDGKIYRLDKSWSGLFYSPPPQTDLAGNIYFLNGRLGEIEASGYTALAKVDLTDPDAPAVGYWTPEGENVVAFSVLGAGDVIYRASVNDGERYLGRLRTAAGRYFNVESFLADGSFTWIAPDGSLYRFSHYDQAGMTPSVVERMQIIPSGIEWVTVAQLQSPLPPLSSHSILQLKGRIFALPYGRYGNQIGIELYSPEGTPRYFDVSFTNIEKIVGAGDYFYIKEGLADGGETLTRFDPISGAATELLGAGLYEIYDFTVSGQGALLVKTFELSSGLQALLEIGAGGEVHVVSRCGSGIQRVQLVPLN